MKELANKRTASKLAIISLAMFGFGYALVPLYDVFCEVTGINGKTGEISLEQAEASAVDLERLVAIEFDTNVNSELPWEFKAVQRKIKVHPGEINEAIFYAKNLSSKTIVGQAVPSVTPSEGSIYFNKTECFCFSQQLLAPGERKEMPVRFVVAPELPSKIGVLTLSYTFFPSSSGVAQDNSSGIKLDDRT